MTNITSSRANARRSASVIIAALVVILVVGILSVQTIQTLAIVRRGDNHRAKIMQAKELTEFARAMDWNTIESKLVTLKIPDKVESLSNKPAGETEARTAVIEKQTLADNPHAAKIVVRFPADVPGEITTTWELENE